MATDNFQLPEGFEIYETGRGAFDLPEGFQVVGGEEDLQEGDFASPAPAAEDISLIDEAVKGVKTGAYQAKKSMGGGLQLIGQRLQDDTPLPEESYFDIAMWPNEATPTEQAFQEKIVAPAGEYLEQKGYQIQAHAEKVIEENPEWKANLAIQKGIIDTVKEKGLASKEGMAAIVRGVSESAPQFAASMGVGIAGGLTGNPILAGIGISTGVGSMYMLEGGSTYSELLEMGVPEQEAAGTAHLVGIINASIEMTGLGVMFKEIPALRKAFSALIVDEAVKKSFGKRVARGALVGALTEGPLEELPQTIVSNAARRLYDENQDLFEGGGEAVIIGSLLGMFGGGGAGAFESNKVEGKQLPPAPGNSPEAVKTNTINHIAKQLSDGNVSIEDVQKLPDHPDFANTGLSTDDINDIIIEHQAAQFGKIDPNTASKQQADKEAKAQQQADDAKILDEIAAKHSKDEGEAGYQLNLEALERDIVSHPGLSDQAKHDTLVNLYQNKQDELANLQKNLPPTGEQAYQEYAPELPAGQKAKFGRGETQTDMGGTDLADQERARLAHEKLLARYNPELPLSQQDFTPEEIERLKYERYQPEAPKLTPERKAALETQLQEAEQIISNQGESPSQAGQEIVAKIQEKADEIKAELAQEEVKVEPVQTVEPAAEITPGTITPTTLVESKTVKDIDSQIDQIFGTEAELDALEEEQGDTHTGILGIADQYRADLRRAAIERDQDETEAILKAIAEDKELPEDRRELVGSMRGPAAEGGDVLPAAEVRKPEVEKKKEEWETGVTKLSNNEIYGRAQDKYGEDIRYVSIKEIDESFGSFKTEKEILADIGKKIDARKSELASRTDIQKLSDFFIGNLDGTKKKISSITTARVLAKTHLGISEEEAVKGSFLKLVDEAIEYAIVKEGRRIVSDLKPRQVGIKKIFERLARLYKDQPRLGTKTGESNKRQAFSTPVPIAFLASELAGIDSTTTVYEPTAGTGMLLIGASPANVIANELDDTRFEILQDQRLGTTTQEDATTTKPPVKVDVVIANPPFGKLTKEDGTSQVWNIGELRTRELDQAIAFKSLESMKDGGRAVLIMGGLNKQVTSEERRTKKYNSGNKKRFYQKLYNDYNVIDHFTISGDLYSKQGAGWPIDIIVIDGKGQSKKATPGFKAPPVYNSFEELGGRLDEKDKIYGVDATREQQDAEDTGNHQGTPAESSPFARPVRPGAGEQAGNVDTEGGGQEAGGGRPGSGAGTVRPASPGISTPGESGQGQPGPGTGADVDSGQPGADVSAAGTDTAGQPGTAQDTEGQPGSKAGAAPADVGGLDERTGPGSLGYGDKNVLVSKDKADAARKRLLAKLGRTQTGIDPEMMADGAILAAYHIEAGSRSFIDYTRAMVADLGTGIKPYLKSLYLSARNFQGMDKTGLQTEAEIDNINIDSLLTEITQEEAKKKAAPKKKAGKKPVASEGQTIYEPSSGKGALGSLVPTNMAGPIQKSLNRIVKKHGSVDSYVARSLDYKEEELGEYFAAEQIDSLALILDNFERGNGFVLGDQTGIGKGRVVAATIRYSLLNGQTPIFLTEKDSLYKDMYRDLVDIGMPENIHEQILMTNQKDIGLDDDGLTVLKSPTGWSRKLADMRGELPAGKKIVFTTYDQFNTQYVGKTQRMAPRRTFLRDLIRRGGKANLIMDESHSAGGSGDLYNLRPHPQTGITPHPRALFMRQIIPDANAVLYSSATYAKTPDVMDLYVATDLKLGVGGNIRRLAAAVTAGGVPFQQITANMLAESGQYIRRERSFEGVTYQPEVFEVDTKSAENISASLQEMRTFEDEVTGPIFEDLGGGQTSASGAGAERGQNFTSLMHNIVSQMVLSLKTPHAVERAIDIVKNGKEGNEQVVLTLSNTMGAFIQSYAEANGINEGDRIDIGFNDLLYRYLWNTRKYLVPRNDGTGEKDAYWLTDEELGEAGLKEYNRIADIINGMNLDGLPVSPVDYMHNELRKAGIQSSEVTGRQQTIDYSGDFPVLRSRPAKELSTNGKNKTIRKFNTGDSKVIILNRSGSTGISLHASEKNPKPGQGKRTMILVQPEADINQHMQMLGRVHRTGQVIPPGYIQAVANIPAEKKLGSMLFSKMKSLNANTTADADSLFTDKETVDFFNRYGDQVATAVMRGSGEINKMLGNPVDPDGTAVFPGAAKRVTGRLPLLPIRQQELIYRSLSEEYNFLIEALNAAGRNDLEAKTYDTDAETTGTEVLQEKSGRSPFQGEVVAETVNMKRISRPLTSDKVRDLIAANKGNEEAMVGALEEFDKTYNPEMLAEADNRIENADTPIKVEAAKLAKTALESRLESTRSQFSRWMEFVEVGRTVSFTFNQHDFSTYGVISNVENRGVTKNPIAFSNWVISVPVHDGGIQVVRQPLSKFEDGGDFSIEARDSIYGRDIIETFDTAAATTREDRTIITGNIFSGFTLMSGKNGRIVHFTRKDGKTSQGVLMPPGFEAGEAINDIPVVINSKQAMAFLQAAAPIQIHLDQTGDFRINFDGRDYRARTTSARSRHRRYTEDDRELLRIVGGSGFFKRGQSMVTDPLTEEQAKKIIDLFIGRGAQWEAREALEAARNVANPKKAAKKKKSDSAERSAQGATIAPGAQRGYMIHTDQGAQPAIEAEQFDLGIAGHDFFIHKHAEGGWAISEASTGMRIARGDTRLDAESEAISVIESIGKQRVVESIASAPKLADTTQYSQSQAESNQFNPAKVEALQDDILGWLEEVLPPSVHKKLVVAATEEITPGTGDSKSKAEHAKLGKQGRYLGGTTFADSVTSAFIQVALQSPESAKKTTYHEAFHVATRWILPKSTYSELMKSFDGNEEAAADAFSEWMNDRKKGLPKGKKSTVREIFKKLKAAFNAVLNGLKGKGFVDVDAVFKSLVEGKYEPHFGKGEGGTQASLFDNETKLSQAPGNDLMKQLLDLQTATPAVKTKATRKAIASKHDHLTVAQQEAIAVGGFGIRETESMKEAAQALMGDKKAQATLKVQLRQGLVDQYGSFKDILQDKEAWMMAHLTKSGVGVLETAIHTGTPFLDQSGAIDVKEGTTTLQDSLMPLGDEIDLWLSWMVGKRAERLKTEDREHLFSDVDIEALTTLTDGAMQDGRKRAEVYEEARKNYEEMNNAIVQIGVDTGLISQENAAIWKKQGFYVPFYRMIDDQVTGPGGDRGRLTNQTAYKKLKGADLPLDDILTNVLNNWSHIVNASLNNQAAAKALDSAVKLEMANEIPEAMHDKNSVFVRQGGEKIWYDVEDTPEGKLIMASLLSLDWEGFNNPAMKVMRKFKRYLTLGVTASPGFKLRNLIRDTIHASAVTNVSHNLIKNVYVGWKSTGGVGGKRMLAGGGAFGESGYINGLDPDALKRLINAGAEKDSILNTTNAFKKLWNGYQDFGARLENVNRAANFEKDLRDGKDLLEANFNARDQLDFTRTGTFAAIRFTAQVVPFLNARLQGLDKIGRAAFGTPAERKRFRIMAGTYALASVALYLAMKDDDDYKEAEEWEKRTYHLFKIPGVDMMFRLPRPFEIGALAYIVEKMTQQVVEDVPAKDFAKELQNTMLETFSFNPIPQMFKPVVELYANKNMFTGRDIESLGMQYRSKTERSRGTTTTIAKTSSKVMDKVLPETLVLSPVQIDHLVRAYGGWLSATIMAGTDMLINTAIDEPSSPAKRLYEYDPLRSIMRDEKGYSSKYVTKFYENLDEISKAYGDVQYYRKTDKTKAAEKFQENKGILRHRKKYNRAVKSMSTLRKRKEGIYNSRDLTPEQKREKVKEINNKIGNLAKIMWEGSEKDFR